MKFVKEYSLEVKGYWFKEKVIKKRRRSMFLHTISEDCSFQVNVCIIFAQMVKKRKMVS